MIQDNLNQILSQYDFILLPNAPTTAWTLGEKIKDPVVMYLEDIFTVQASLAGLPAISVPVAEHSNGLPIGMQLIGKKFDEGNLLSFSKTLLNINKKA
ncbi:Glutamyl-tRNA(Gln) amidotransferase subunit A [compost metagenome]